MNLTEADFKIGHEIVEKCLNLEETEIKNYIQECLDFFIKKSKLDISKLDHRNKIFQFLNHQSTLFLNFQINPELYMLGDKEIKNAELGVSIITEIIFTYRKSGLNKKI